MKIEIHEDEYVPQSTQFWIDDETGFVYFLFRMPKAYKVDFTWEYITVRVGVDNGSYWGSGDSISQATYRLRPLVRFTMTSRPE